MQLIVDCRFSFVDIVWTGCYLLCSTDRQETHDEKHKIRIQVYSSKESGVITVDGSKVYAFRTWSAFTCSL